MGSFGDILKPLATAGGFAIGGPAAAGLAGFGSSALTGGDFRQALTSGVGGSTLSGTTSSISPATFGEKFTTSLGFGKDPLQNFTNGGNLLLNLTNKQPATTNPYSLLIQPKQSSLVDALNKGSY